MTILTAWPPPNCDKICMTSAYRNIIEMVFQRSGGDIQTETRDIHGQTFFFYSDFLLIGETHCLPFRNKYVRYLDRTPVQMNWGRKNELARLWPTEESEESYHILNHSHLCDFRVQTCGNWLEYFQQRSFESFRNS